MSEAYELIHDMVTVDGGRPAMRCHVVRESGGNYVAPALAYFIACDAIFKGITEYIAEECLQPSAGAPDFTVLVGKNQNRPSYTLKVRGGFGFRLIVCDYSAVGWRELGEWQKRGEFTLSFLLESQGGIDLPTGREAEYGEAVWRNRRQFRSLQQLYNALPHVCEAVWGAYRARQTQNAAKRDAKKWAKAGKSKGRNISQPTEQGAGEVVVKRNILY